jgi:hypothetical protein
MEGSQGILEGKLEGNLGISEGISEGSQGILEGKLEGNLGILEGNREGSWDSSYSCCLEGLEGSKEGKREGKGSWDSNYSCCLEGSKEGNWEGRWEEGLEGN